MDYTVKLTISVAGAANTSVSTVNINCIDIGVEELLVISDYSLSPNPVDQQITLTLESSLQKDARLEILDITGRLIQSRNWSAQNVQMSIHVADITNGVYLIRLQGQSQSVYLIERVVVNH